MDENAEGGDVGREGGQREEEGERLTCGVLGLYNV